MHRAYLTFETCAADKAKNFARIDGSMAEVATASISACRSERNALIAAYAAHYEALAGDPGTSREFARGTVEALTDDVAAQLLAVIAEERSKP